MLKTSRAYFCQTVIEGSPWSRISSKIASQARQSFEALFKRPPRTDGVVVKPPVPHQYQGRAWGGGLISQIHANSRGILTKFVERNRTSELVSAMRQRYGARGAFRSGVWGQKLATFAFVGVGVAAGAQWNMYSDLQDRVNIMDLFQEKTNFEMKAPATMAIERVLPEPECEMSLELTEHDSSDPSFILLESLTFDSLDAEAAEDPVDVSASVIDFVFHGEETSEPDYEMASFKILDEEEELLAEQLQKSLLKVEAQRTELDSVRASLVQLHELLHELVGTTDDQESFVACAEPPILEVEVLMGSSSDDVQGQLMKSLSVIGQQQSQLSHFRQQLQLQNQQLHRAYEAATDRPVVMRSSFSKRDACCGPGTTIET